ncbi:phytanoyl-CoA dioxygenase family protein [Actinopolymorpha pittospori]|uniref:Phytanoyl-CoA dioxygenase (PhyH) n=1 Tax=Actinopolymorpha pittospori TaxID=648752 RepID=A0A927N6Q3_9ACTN|nr:phytanoyl-CoA dioxygenase family protein [Actinopolymorpha pittospori]MBE1613169.1 hypothetical protein [Actinopolymorpha pittospori]
MLTAEQRAEFDLTGIVKLEGAFSAADASAMRAVVWKELAVRHGIHEDDPSTWTPHYVSGMKTTKRHPAFQAILGPPLRAALDDLLGPGRWQEPKHQGQVLVTLPNADSWRVPHHMWHTDVGYDTPPGQLIGVKHWAFVDAVEPGGGGTVQLAGSHRLLERYVSQLPADKREYKHVRDSFLRSHPWLRGLSKPDDDPDRNRRLMDVDTDIDGLPARVVELTGRPGDVYLTHLWVMHAAAPNASARPRMMRSRPFYPLDAGPAPE